MNLPEITLEFDKIKDMLCACAVSDPAKKALCGLSPALSQRECRRRMTETTEARRILDRVGAPPLPVMKDLDELLALCEKGTMLTPDQLEGVSVFLVACKRMCAYLQRAQSPEAGVSCYGQSIDALTDLKEEIDSSVRGGTVLSSASPALRDIRRKIENQDGQIRRKLEEILRGKRAMFSDSSASVRNGRFVLPVKKEYKHQVSGTVVDVSGTGGTYFIEPAAVSRLQDEISLLKIEEDNEIRKVLYTLTALVDDCACQLRQNVEVMTVLDVMVAKARLSADKDAVPAELTL